ncbi:MAG: TonB family protein [Pseudomonadota bacterium]
MSETTPTVAAAAAPITPRDRFNFCLFIAIALHAALILGVSFSSELNQPKVSSIDVTLSVASDAIDNPEADFLAATTQQGSGDADEALEMTTDDVAPFAANELNDLSSAPLPIPEETTLSRELLTSTQADTAASKELRELQEALDSPISETIDREKLIQEIANLEARISADRQALAKMPRTKRINSMSTRSADEAAYLNMWRQKCERIGKANYPPGNLEGEVLMLVSILFDGTLEEVRILRSSGHRALDQAALATVRQASPYQPFNVAMRKAYDRLEFTRTWQFTKRGNALMQ